jgi:hypothetical protein
MKVKAILLACVIACFTASAALADHGGHDGGGDHHGRHHDNEHANQANNPAVPAGCVRVELSGSLASVSASSFTLMVAKADVGDDEDNDDDDDNNNAPATPNLVGQTLTIAVDANAEVSFKTVGTLTGPAVGDTAKVEANMCGTPATFTAVEIKVTAAKLSPAAAQNLARKLKSKHH